MDFWLFFLSVLWVVGVALVFLGVFAVITRAKRKDLRSAAEIEYEEMSAREGWGKSTSFLRRAKSEDERKRREWLVTEAGRELFRLEDKAKWVALIVYFSKRIVAG